MLLLFFTEVLRGWYFGAIGAAGGAGQNVGRGY